MMLLYLVPKHKNVLRIGGKQIVGGKLDKKQNLVGIKTIASSKIKTGILITRQINKNIHTS